MTISRETAAAERRAAAVGGQQVRAAAGAPSKAARSVAFPTVFRAQLVERDGTEYHQLNGVASVTDKPYAMYDMFGEYDETITREAFTETLAANPDVSFLVNHKGLSMARTTNGSLILSMGETGLESEAYLNPKRQDVADLVVAIDDKTITEMSFAFMLEEGWWNDDFTQFKITKLSIDRGDVSAVNYGANPYTSISARELDDFTRLPAGAARAVLERLESRGDLVATSPAPPTPAPATRTSGMDLTRLQAWIAYNS